MRKCIGFFYELFFQNKKWITLDKVVIFGENSKMTK